MSTTRTLIDDWHWLNQLCRLVEEESPCASSLDKAALSLFQIPCVLLFFQIVMTAFQPIHRADEEEVDVGEAEPYGE